jgi:hypothetical protein
MKLFVFLITVYGAGPDGIPLVYVNDYNLTGDDCITLMQAYAGPDVPSCEIDTGIHHD